MTSFIPRTLCLLGLLVASVTVRAQTYSVIDGYPHGGGGPVFDERHQRAVYLGSSRRWEWRGRWQLDPVTLPAQSTTFIGPAMYDGHRGVVYKVGAAMQVIEWNGMSFHTYSSPSTPPGRVKFMLAFDRNRRRLVLYGGSNPRLISHNYVMQVPRDDTWEWDGQSWTQVQGVMPPARYDAGMAFDQQRGYTVLVGGYGTSGIPVGTWTYNGAWQSLPGATTPLAGHLPTPAVFDPGLGSVVTIEDNGTTRALLAFDGSQWNMHPAPPVEVEDLVPAGNGDLLASNWLRQGGQWTEIVQAASGATVWDTVRDSLLIYNGSSLLRWKQGWSRITSAPAPPERWSHSLPLVFDAARAEAVLFGGAYGFFPIFSHGDTWTSDGTSWQQHLPQHSPAARQLHTLAYDVANQRVVLFGGRSFPAVMAPATLWDDTWTWDGTDWLEHLPTSSPSPRITHMAYDEAQQRCVLAGGSDGSLLGPLLTDTWEWDGTSWAQRGSTGAPRGGLRYDPVSQRVVSWALAAQAYPAQVAVYWDGANWVPFPSTVPADQWPQVFDPTRDRWLRSLGSLEVLGPTPHGAQVYGSGCGLVAPVLQVSGSPSPGNAAFELSVATHHASTPTFLMFALQQAQQSIGSGCTVLVANPSILPGVAGATTGFADFPLVVPNGLALRRLTLHVQGLTLNATAPLGLQLTQGLRIVVGD